MRLFKKSIITLILVFIDNIIALILSVLLARTLSTTDYGLLQTLYGLTALIFNIINFGIVSATNKEILHHEDKKNIIFNGFTLITLLSLTFLTLSSLFIKPTKTLLGINISDNLLYLLIPLIIFNLIFYFLKTNLIALGKPLLNSLFGVMNIILYSFPVLLILLMNNLNVKNVMGFRIISFVIPSIFILLHFFKKIPKFSFTTIKKILKNAKLTFISTTIVVAMDYLSKPILGLISLEEVAYYSIALTYSKLIIILQTGLKSILFSLVGGIAAKKDVKSLKKGLTFWFDVIIKVVIPISFILIIMSEDVINFIYSNRYENANIFVVFTILGAVISILSLPESAIFYGLNKLKDKNKFNLLRAVIYLPLLLILTLLFSGIGVAFSYLLLSLINLTLFLLFLKKYNIHNN